MRLTPVNGPSGPQAVGGYSQAILVEQATRLLLISGQIPETRDGDVPQDFESQCRLVWSNVLAQLHAAGLSVSNLARVTTYLSSRRHADANSRIRQEILGEHRPALTIIVAGIFDERWLLEIEAIAAA